MFSFSSMSHHSHMRRQHARPQPPAVAAWPRHYNFAATNSFGTMHAAHASAYRYCSLPIFYPPFDLGSPPLLPDRFFLVMYTSRVLTAFLNEIFTSIVADGPS
ncbi:hypothetical protein P3342_006765 [Pyrenophora teres f. teres]|nr:hypothetical protein P3342_006765 [Pyrenophora teres f. teres]